MKRAFFHLSPDKPEGRKGDEYQPFRAAFLSGAPSPFSLYHVVQNTTSFASARCAGDQKTIRRLVRRKKNSVRCATLVWRLAAIEGSVGTRPLPPGSRFVGMRSHPQVCKRTDHGKLLETNRHITASEPNTLREMRYHDMQPGQAEQTM